MIAELHPKPQQDLMARLNEEQKQAVTHGWGPSLVIAGAGSGKTTVLTRRIAYLTTVLDRSVPFEQRFAWSANWRRPHRLYGSWG